MFAVHIVKVHERMRTPCALTRARACMCSVHTYRAAVVCVDVRARYNTSCGPFYDGQTNVHTANIRACYAYVF